MFSVERPAPVPETLQSKSGSIREVPVQHTEMAKETLAVSAAPGSILPLYSFARRYASKHKRVGSSGDLRTVPDFIDHSSDSSDGEGEKSLLDTLLLAKWEDRMQRDLFRYDVTACETKVLEGEYGFIAQLNTGRHLKKRPTEFSVDKVLQDFDPKKFNFTKISPEEVLFRFEEGDAPVSAVHEKAKITGTTNVVLINVSPIEYGHVLLVPRVLDCLPQRVQSETLLLAIQMAVEGANPYLRVAYNSLGAFATINQLHFQAYYLNAPFPIEKAPTRRVRTLKRKRAVKLSVLENYPVRTVVYELGNSLEEMAAAVAAACQALERQNIPFNLLIADMGRRIFLMPQCFAEKQARNEVPPELLESQVNPAAWEISGHIVLKREEDYASASEEKAWRLLEEVSLPKWRFWEVLQICVEEAERSVVKKLNHPTEEHTSAKSRHLVHGRGQRKGVPCLRNAFGLALKREGRVRKEDGEGDDEQVVPIAVR